MDLEKEYEMEIDNIVRIIKKNSYKKIYLQFPDGLKPNATSITKKIREETNSEIFIWLGSCFGACDLPPSLDLIGIDLLVQFGHTKWNYSFNDKIKVL